jgi:hypothetical protein
MAARGDAGDKILPQFDFPILADMRNDSGKVVEVQSISSAH